MSFVGIILRVTTDCNVAAAETELTEFVLQRLPMHS